MYCNDEHPQGCFFHWREVNSMAKGYEGKIGSGATQTVKAPYPVKSSGGGKVRKGKDLRA
jgi:hypothetical protein